MFGYPDSAGGSSGSGVGGIVNGLAGLGGAGTAAAAGAGTGTAAGTIGHNGIGVKGDVWLTGPNVSSPPSPST